MQLRLKLQVLLKLSILAESSPIKTAAKHFVMSHSLFCIRPIGFIERLGPEQVSWLSHELSTTELDNKSKMRDKMH